jgi:hypothetical protein
VYVNNTSENKLLGHYEADKAELGKSLMIFKENLWKIGTADTNGYFNLTHLESEKLLTATSSPSNTLKVDKSTWQKKKYLLGCWFFELLFCSRQLIQILKRIQKTSIPKNVWPFLF